MGLFNKKTEPPVEPEEGDPNEERFKQLEDGQAAVQQTLAAIASWIQQAGEPAPEPDQTKDQTKELYSPFLDKLAEEGSQAILTDPDVNAVLDVRMSALLDCERARGELAKQFPEAYDPTSDVYKTKQRVRQWYEEMGVHPSVLNTRRMEESMTREAIGAHFDKVAEGRRPAGRPGFVEGGSGAGMDLAGSGLTQRETEIADIFGVKPEDYKKLRDQLIEQEVVAGARK